MTENDINSKFICAVLPMCSGAAPERELKLWFGNRSGITREEIIAAQACELAQRIRNRAEELGLIKVDY